MLVELIILASILIYILYKQWKNSLNYWKDRGFPYIEGKFPFGTEQNNIFITDYFGKSFQKLYKKLAPHPIGGYYLSRNAELIVRDLDLIKLILVKDFNYFRDRSNIPAKHLFSKHLFRAEGDLWRALRVKLTPTFTSAKLKLMFNLFLECSKKLDQHFQELCDKGEDVDIKHWMGRFNTDIISTCAFGLDSNALDKPDNVLRKVGMTAFHPRATWRNKFIRYFSNTFPILLKIISIQIMPLDIELSLIKVIKETMDYREKNNLSRNDFLDLLIKMKDHELLKGENQNGDDIKMDLNLIAAQCFVFFAAGYETSSSVLTFCLHELLFNEEIQIKVQNEIDEVMKRYNGKLTYEAVKEMTYLEQVINETVRKYPTLPILTRVCTKTYKIPETNLNIETGTRLTIPVYAIHHDPKYYPEPEKFKPDRFSPENRTSIPEFAFLPFGSGPRMCIGMRFGLLQTKIGIITILSKYKLRKSPETVEKFTFSPTPLVTTVEEKVVMKFQLRNKETVY